MLFEKEGKTLPNIPGTRTEMFGVAAVQNSAFITGVADDKNRPANVDALKELYNGIAGSIEEVKNCKTELEVLNKLSAYYGGADDATSVADAITNITIAEYNPLAALEIDFDISKTEDLFGKHVDDLQKDVYLKGKNVYGISHYVTGYTEFSSNPAEQQGNYIALHAAVPDVEGVSITVNGKPLGEDGLIVLIIPKGAYKVRVTASKLGSASVTKEYNLSKLTLEK